MSWNQNDIKELKNPPKHYQNEKSKSNGIKYISCLIIDMFKHKFQCLLGIK